MKKFALRSLFAVTAMALAAAGTAQTYEQLENPPAENWPLSNRDVTSTRYTSLDQITPENASDLQLVWARDLDITHTGFVPMGVYGSPSVWDGIMYVGTDTGVMALDAATGEQLWRYSSPNPGATTGDASLRGSPVLFEGQVFITTRWGAAIGLDAETGEELWTVVLTQEELEEGFTTQPVLADGRLVLATTGADNGGAPGRIMSLDVSSGEVLWTFNTVPLDPSDPAYATWTNPPSWEEGIGGASAWNSGTYDPVSRVIVYGTGQPTPWDRISERRFNEGEPSKDLYSASFVALDIDTGELKWYHQVVPGDEWDYDQQIVPIFADLEIDGETRRTAILATTTGFVVLVDAETGEFILANQITEETTVHMGYDEEGNSIINPEARFTEEGQFARVCPGLRWAHQAPGAFSEDTGLLYRPNEHACINFGPRAMPSVWAPGDRAWYMESGPTNASYFSDRYGGLSAIDPVTGEIVWEFGHYYGHDAGPVVTGGGMVFSAFLDSKIRGFDAQTGEIVWEAPLTAASKAGTISYAVDGVQYVATIAGGVPGGPVNHPDADVAPSVGGSPTLFVFALQGSN